MIPADRPARFRLSVALGTATASLVGLTYGAALVASGQSDPLRSLAYNCPISLPFLILCWDIALAAAQESRRVFARRYGPVLAIWACGFVVLYLRLMAKSINVSGHMTWVTLMATQALVLRLPPAFLVLTVAVLAEAAWFNFVLMSGRSGLGGLIVGCLLSALLVLLSRGRGGRNGL
jgi:hypothetical protein